MDKIFNDPQQYIDMGLDFGIKAIIAIVVWIIGSWIIKLILRKIGKLMVKRDVDPSLRGFLKTLMSVLLKVALIITIISQLGVETTSFVAILGAAGLALGLALSGTLQNFAGGVMILLFKPFKIGDYIAAQGHDGIVDEIQIFNTILKSLDNKTIIIPNGGLATNSMVNYTAEPTRRVDWTFGIGYGDDVATAQSVMTKMLEADPRVLKDPAIFVEVSALADSSVNFAVRAWVKTEDYWDVYFDMNRHVYEGFDKAGLNIPFPQMDVHVHKTNEAGT
jgi:small conductance mechanosensitive channel